MRIFLERITDIIKLMLVLGAAMQHPHLGDVTAATEHLTRLASDIEASRTRAVFAQLFTHLEAGVPTWFEFRFQRQASMPSL